MTLEGFVERPLRIALALASGGCGGTYAEATILVSAAMSAIASHVWPGERIDRVRFAEAWVQFGTPMHPDAANTSFPLLIHTLFDGREAEAVALRNSRPGMFGPGYSSRVVVGAEVDGDEAEALGTCPGLTRTLVREHSYPVVFYRRVRSQLVHEYELGGHATEWPMTLKEHPRVSYSNTMRGMWVDGVDLDASVREIHFHIEWLVELTRAMAREVDESAPHGNLPRPAIWWVDA